jgi:hypothetical protein
MDSSTETAPRMSGRPQSPNPSDPHSAWKRSVFTRDATSDLAAGRVHTPLMWLPDPNYSKSLIMTLAETTPVSEAAELQDDLRPPASKRTAGSSTQPSPTPAPPTRSSDHGTRSRNARSHASAHSRRGSGPCRGNPSSDTPARITTRARRLVQERRERAEPHRRNPPTRQPATEVTAFPSPSICRQRLVTMVQEDRGGGDHPTTDRSPVCF